MPALLLAAALSAQACIALNDVQLDNTTITAAEVITAGQQSLPEHCRVKLEMTPSDESLIKAELWLPMENWNGKYMAIGNGGWAGSIQGYNDMQQALLRGYATAASDNGSAFDQPNGMFALGKSERVVDFAYRALHDMTSTSKTLIQQAYEKPTDLSYYKGCSTGGRQGLMAAQRYPADYDGIIAGAPANRHIHMHVAQSWELMRISKNPQAAITQTTANLVNAAVQNKCDVLDEGFVSNPQQCTFDFNALQCSAGTLTGTTDSSCLSPAQLETVEIYYGGVFNSAGEEVFAGRALSVPLSAMVPSEQAPTAFLFDSISILGFEDPDYDWRSFDLDRDLPMIDQKAGIIDANDTDLRAFKARGGKILMYHGWQDPGISPKNAIDYYIGVMHEMDENPQQWLQLYMVPGMGHCSGGPGPDSFDTISVLEDWHEAGITPTSIIGENRRSGLSRPLCPYPAESVYLGSGDLKNAESWSCQVP